MNTTPYLLEEVCVRGEHHDDRLGEPPHVPPPDVRVLALQLLQHLEALSKLREHVHNRVGEVGVLGVLLELFFGKGEKEGEEGKKDKCSGGKEKLFFPSSFSTEKLFCSCSAVVFVMPIYFERWKKRCGKP